MNLQPIRDLLRARIGLDASTLGASALASAVERRLAATHTTDLATYLNFLSAPNSKELVELVELVVVPESWFFRTVGLFPRLAAFIRDEVRTRSATMVKAPQPFRVLSIPCAGGEEPYSLAIALTEAGVAPSAYALDAVDLSRENLARAQKGRYSAFAFRGIPPDLLQRYFRPAGTQWEIDPAIRSAVRFQQANLVDPRFLAGAAPYNLVLCRNVLIYFAPAARAVCLDHIGRLLAPAGLLGVGSAEPQLLASRGYVPFEDEKLFLFRQGTGAERSKPRSAGRAKQPQTARRVATAPSRSAPTRPTCSTGPMDLARDGFEQARALADSGRAREALDMCRTAIEKNPTADGYSLLGVLYQSGQQLEEAAAAFRKALYLNPEQREALLHLMLLHRERGELSQAERLRRRLARREDGES